MSKRLLRKLGTTPQVKVYRDPEWDEYVVKQYDEHGRYLPEADYFTNDQGDALATAEHLLGGLRARATQHVRSR
jgi:hypothetical protein